MKVSVVKCGEYEKEKVRKCLLDSLKNIDFEIKEGIRILIKPNVLGAHKPEKGIDTHPVVLEELCKILKEKNCEIIIGDSSAVNTNKAFEVSGIKNLSGYCRVVNFEGLEKKVFDILGEEIPLPKILFEVDLIINFAKLKTHVLTRVTLCAKNLYGCVPGNLKNVLHKKFPKEKEFLKMIYEIDKIVKPELNIVDGVVGIEGDGPGVSGKIKKVGVLIAGKNIFAVDIIGSELMGFDSSDIVTNKLSGIDKNKIEVVGNGRNLKFEFEKPSIPPMTANFFWRLIPKPKISFNEDNCVKCGLCEEKCPMDAIDLKPYPICDSKKCVRCLCCMEVCPHKAVFLKDSKLKKFLKKLMRR